MCEAYDCKPMYHGKVAGQFVYKFMLNVKIQNQKTNVQSTNYMSRFCRVSCENSTGLVSLTDYPDKFLSNCFLRVQADSGVDTDATKAQDDFIEQNVGFSDASNNVISEIPHPMNHVKVDSSQNIELGKFLNRPVQIYEKLWGIGNTIDAATTNFDPWHLFFNKTSIKKKLDNYYMVRCNLHLKFVINASPFFYGCVMVAYQPLPLFNPAPVIISATTRKENISYSQRPHIYLYPQNCQGGEMVLPFLYHKNWINATSASDLTSMGNIAMNSFNPLANANGVVSDNISITVYAWAEDIEVAGPTPSLAVQASSSKKKDEYSHEGSISRPASAIARAAGRLSSIPIIGEFATATSYAAGAVADIAALFGYTDVPVIDDVHAFAPKPFPNMAATDIGIPVEKLTLDAKNELSIDAKIAGVNVDDEMVISSFVSRESYIYNSVWSASDAANTSLLFAKVTPTMMDTESVTNGSIVWSTPMNHVAQCFQYWRGDIIFRFKFICSKYHRGRVRINWSPFGNMGTSGDYTTESYTRIVDITEENDVEFVVPYTQPTSYLRTSTFVGTEVAQASTSISGLGSVYNGIITVRVLNQQSSPVTSADIQMLTFVRGADNLEFSCPTEISSRFSPYAIQADSYDEGNSRYELGVKPSVADDNINLIYMGEHVSSLRQLMRRSAAYKRICPGENTSTEFIMTMRSVLPRQPQYPGFDTDGFETAVGLTSAVSEPYNWVNWTYATWFSTCFVGSRGAYHYYVNATDLQDVGSVTVARTRDLHDATNYTVVNLDLPVTHVTDLRRRFCDTDNQSIGLTGLSLTNQSTMSAVNASVPMYSRFKFMSNDTNSRSLGQAADESNTDSMSVTTISRSRAGQNVKFLNVDIYCSVGTDFNLIFFLNIPAIYYYDSIPAAV